MVRFPRSRRAALPLAAAVAAALLPLAAAAPAAAEVDTTGPELATAELSPSAVNLHAGPQQVTLTARVTDSSGLHGDTLVWRVPAGAGGGTTVQLVAPRISGTAQDGVYAGTWEVPVETPDGLWGVRLERMCDVGGACSDYGYLHSSEWRFSGFGLTVSHQAPTQAAPEPTPSSSTPPQESSAPAASPSTGDTSTPSGDPAPATPSATPSSGSTAEATAPPMSEPAPEPTPTPEPSPEPELPSAVTVTTQSSRITYGESVPVQGFVAYDGRSAAGAVVELWAETRERPRWLLTRVTANSWGEYVYTSRPSGWTRFTAVVDGVSASADLQVVPRVAVSAPSSTTAVPTASRFTGSVAPARAGIVVGVSIKRSTGTTLLARGTTDSAGRYSIPVRLPASGTYVVATRATTALLAGSTTRQVRVAGTTTTAPTSSTLRRGATTQPRIGDGIGEIRTINAVLDRGARKARVDVVFHRLPYSFENVVVSLGVLSGGTCQTYGSGRPNVYYSPWSSTTGTPASLTSTRGSSSARTGGRLYALTGTALANPYTCVHVEVWWAHDWKYHWDNDCNCATRIYTSDEASVRLS